MDSESGTGPRGGERELVRPKVNRAWRRRENAAVQKFLDRALDYAARGFFVLPVWGLKQLAQGAHAF